MNFSQFLKYGLVVIVLVVLVLGVRRFIEERPQTGSSINEVQQGTDYPMKETVGDMTQTKSEYERKIQEQIDRFGSLIHKLKERSTESVSDVKDSLNNQIERLEEKMQVARVKLTELRASGEEAWRDMKAVVDEAVDDLEKSYDRAAWKIKGS